MKYIVYFIVGGISAIVFSYIAETYSRTTAISILVVLFIVAIVLLILKHSK